MAFSHKYNTDDSIIRANIVGLVNELNNRIKFENVWDDNRITTVRVPFFYAMSGDERFLQDYFSNWSDCAPDFIEGNTDPIPRGTIFMQGYSVLAMNLTSRYVRGYYTKEIDGELKRFNSYINSIPIQMNFNAEILVDTSIDSFKISQAITEYLYRTQTFSVNYKGFRVPTQIGFPDSVESGKLFDFTYGQTDRIKISFPIELQTYLPVVDDLNEMSSTKNITTTITSTSTGIFNSTSTNGNTGNTNGNTGTNSNTGNTNISGGNTGNVSISTATTSTTNTGINVGTGGTTLIPGGTVIPSDLGSTGSTGSGIIYPASGS